MGRMASGRPSSYCRWLFVHESRSKHENRGDPSARERTNDVASFGARSSILTYVQMGTTVSVTLTARMYVSTSVIWLGVVCTHADHTSGSTCLSNPSDFAVVVVLRTFEPITLFFVQNKKIEAKKEQKRKKSNKKELQKVFINVDHTCSLASRRPTSGSSSSSTVLNSSFWPQRKKFRTQWDSERLAHVVTYKLSCPCLGVESVKISTSFRKRLTD
jgi:hypothetical protein